VKSCESAADLRHRRAISGLSPFDVSKFSLLLAGIQKWLNGAMGLRLIIQQGGEDLVYV